MWSSSSLILVVSISLVSAMPMTSGKPRILSVGLSAIDFVATVPHFPQADEKIRSTSLVTEGGGNAANTACAIANLGFAHVACVTAVGDDANGQSIVDGLEKYNVDTSLIERYPGSSPFTYIMCTDVDGQSTRTCIHQPSDGELSFKAVDSIPLNDYTTAHFDVRYPKAAMRLAKRCVQAGIPYSVDVERPRDGLLELLQDASIVICNSQYCDTILGPSDDSSDTGIVQRLKQVMKEQAPKAKLIVTTLGGRGSCLIPLYTASDESEHVLLQDADANIPIVTQTADAVWCSAWGDVTVVDTTGAGDVFQGGFLTALWSYIVGTGATLDQPSSTTALAHVLRVATRVAACKVQAPGARQGLPNSDDAFIQSEMKRLLGP